MYIDVMALVYGKWPKRKKHISFDVRNRPRCIKSFYSCCFEISRKTDANGKWNALLIIPETHLSDFNLAKVITRSGDTGNL